MSRYRDVFAAPPTISTRAELDQLRAGRLAPVPERSPAPSPEERLAAYRERYAVNEDRLAELAHRLETARERTASDYSFAAQKGRAKIDFEQSR